MLGCRICQSGSIFEAQNLSCGHRFCKECLLALLPNSRDLISVHPDRIAAVICPRCNQLCQYSRIHETKLGLPATFSGRSARSTEAPPASTDEREKKRRRKRALFVETYRREHDRLNRNSRSRLYDSYFKEDEIPSSPGHVSYHRGGNMNGARRGLRGGGRRSKTGRRFRGGQISHDDVRAIDHVNGRFVACKIIPGPGQVTGPGTLGDTAVGERMEHAALPPRRELHRPVRVDLSPSVSASNFVTSTENTATACSQSMGIQPVVAGLLVVLFVVIVVVTSLMTVSFGHDYKS